jgi:NADH dehydrogenase FAD-containing subunit
MITFSHYRCCFLCNCCRWYRSNTFGLPGVEEHCLFLKTTTDARKIRQRIVECFEHAEQPTTSHEEKQNLLHFVIVGGGPTGVEFAAELSGIYPPTNYNIVVIIGLTEG